MSEEYVDLEDIFGDGENGGGRKPPKKLFGSTNLQLEALAAVGRRKTGFKDNKQLKAFQEIEALAAGADPESRVWAAWMRYRIAETAKLNGGAIKVNMDELIRRIKGEKGNVQRIREGWFIDNREKVLNKKTVAEISGELGFSPGVDEMERGMERRKNARS